MHLQPQGETQQPTRPCRYCGTPFIARRRWQEFCCTPHRNAWHGAEAHREQIRAAAPELYEALLNLRKAISDFNGHGMPGFQDRADAYVLLSAADLALSKAGYRGPKPA